MHCVVHRYNLKFAWRRGDCYVNSLFIILGWESAVKQALQMLHFEASHLKSWSNPAHRDLHSLLSFNDLLALDLIVKHHFHFQEVAFNLVLCTEDKHIQLIYMQLIYILQIAIQVIPVARHSLSTESSSYAITLIANEILIHHWTT